MNNSSDAKTEQVAACPVCTSLESADFTVRVDRSAVKRCRACGTLFLSERPAELAKLYEAHYFSLEGFEQQRSGVGYQTGYTSIEEQFWQVGLTLVAADILRMPFRRILDVGCATGQFLALCQAFGGAELCGNELSSVASSLATQRGFSVEQADVEAYNPSRTFQMVTAWDLVEHLPNPRSFAEGLFRWLDADGAFCFSTPNGEAPLQLDAPDAWEGFAHSYEHLFYLSRKGFKLLLEPHVADVFFYPITLYGGDFLIGIATKKAVSARQRELLEALFERPERLIAAVESGELTGFGACGLIALYMMLGQIQAAKQLVDMLPRFSSRLPSGMVDLLTASVLARLGMFEEAEERYRLAGRFPALTEIALSSQVALLRLRLQQDERALDQVRQEADLSEQSFQRIQAEHEAYRHDKESYIFTLRSQLDRLSWAHRLMRIPGKVKSKLRGGFCRLIPRALKRRWRALGYEGLVLEPQGRTVLYASSDLYPDYQPRVLLETAVGRAERRVTLITTVRNEGPSVDRWLKAISEQTRKPDEIVVVDAGSTDDTVERLNRFAVSAPFPVRVMVAPGSGIAQGRNLAIQAASHEVIACTDLGCHPDRTWLERIVTPFMVDQKTEVVAGWTEAHADTSFQKALAFLTVPRQGTVDPQNYLPSSRTFAFTRDAWERVGGYPEWLTFAGEDTFFAMLLKNRCAHWAFVPEAVVRWHMRSTWRAVFRQAYLYGKGDGEAALFSERYKGDMRNLGVLALAVLMIMLTFALASAVQWQGVLALGFATCAYVAYWALRKSRRISQFYLPGLDGSERRLASLMLWVIVFARTRGFLHGMSARTRIAQKRFASTRGTCVIFSGVPIHDSGGGQRATQLALEFLDQGYRVVFLNQYPSYESRELHLPIQHPHLELNTVELFDVRAFLMTLDSPKPLLAIAEFPHPAFLPALESLKANGARIVYDLIDEWRSSLGSDWYTESTERRYYEVSDLLVASAQTLADRLSAESQREVVLAPNAVNLRMFHRGEYPKPVDMVTGSLTVTYVGALWGEWFDWEQLISLAEAYPKASVVVIGDYRGQCPKSLPNLHFLGLKAQRELPAYLAHSDVAIIPFKLSDLTQAVSPLKVFEYLAMGVPVVSTPLRELEGMPYVYTGATHDDFNALVKVAAATTVEPEIIERFIDANSWRERVERILAGLDLLQHRKMSVPSASHPTKVL